MSTPPGREGLDHGVEAFPRREHVEHHAIDAPRLDHVEQSLGEVAQLDLPSGRLRAEEGRDVRARDQRELLAALEGDQSTLRADRSQQREGERAGSDPGLDDSRAREDVGLLEDLAGILRVDDRGAARHRHDEVAEQGPEREVGVAVAALHHRAVGRADQHVVLEQSAMGVEHLAGLQGDGVQPTLGPGELDAVARDEGAALAGHARTSLACTRARSASVTPSRPVQRA